MRKGGGGRRGARGDPRGLYREGPAADGERDVLGRGPLSLLRVCGDRLRERPSSQKLIARYGSPSFWGLYYSYFKIIIEAPSFWSGVCAIMNDKLTEYPLVINTLQRFNLYPEVVLASWYRIYTTIMDFLGLPTKTCWTVNRGKGLSPVESCEGLGDPASFYVAVIFLLNGFMMSLFFIYGTYLSGSRLGGLVTVLCFFFNHGEIASLFAVCIMGYIDSSKLQKILSAHMVSLLVCFILMFGNSMLLTSYYAASLVVISAILEWSPKVLKKRKREVYVWVIEGCAWLFGTVTLKYLTSRVFGIADDLVFHALQLLAYSVLAILIMRLKLFLTPHLCIMASLVCSKQLFGWLYYKIQPKTLVFAILALMTIEGSANLRTQWNIMGEFSNLPQEELLEWIKVNTRQDAVFAGAMPTMASVKLSTLRPIVNHPHYEDAGLRARTKVVYSMYSRKPASQVKSDLVKLGVNYYILEESLCVSRKKPGCSMPEIWDVEDPANRGKIPLCTLMSKDSRPYFITVFENSNYRVLKIPKE
ncbi:hypothetical protein DUI87_18542 [Hirundo rustica rustica]|uniref:C-mannosyltransferase DPY19L1 n=1 Tax=Hirundo rustica rustica TaxID=333673 RepID=A0A3M0JWG3_HIRRU|nr:hypothetical protein DUI87_18542 [Hirundo rustica rustica]